ncbi:MAG: GntR family transcriptional regulator, partial [Sphingomonadaceae bacterium]
MNIIVRTLSDQLFELVRRRILAGDISADLPIKQDMLAAELGVSKIPLREALARLEQDGLVTSQPNRGFFVCPMTASEAEEIFALRLQIEPDAVGFGTLAATDSDRALAREAFRALSSRSGPDDVTIGERNRAFHLALVRPG